MAFNMCSPSDDAEEVLVDALDATLKLIGIALEEDKFELLSLWFLGQMSTAYSAGYREAKGEEELFRDLFEESKSGL